MPYNWIAVPVDGGSEANADTPSASAGVLSERGCIAGSEDGVGAGAVETVTDMFSLSRSTSLAIGTSD